jgi:cytochrome c oxidase assembly protein subunit 15
MQGEALLWLAIKAVAIAALPLLYVFLRSRPEQRLRHLTWVTAFLTFDLILFGAFTRLTDSGLGCPDWPGCYGHANPLSAGEEIRTAESALPSGPVTMTKAWIEMLHRYFAMAVGFLIIVLMVMSWRRWLRMRLPAHAPWLASFTLFAVCLQGAFGAWTVTMKLQPAIVTTHLLGGISLLLLLAWAAMRERGRPPVGTGALSLRPLVRASFALLAVQIALGGWVSTNYAVMACPDFPLCHGRLVPDMDFVHGFTLWRDLGMTGAGEPIPFQALVAIHWVHRKMAYVVLAVLALLAWRAWNIDGLRGPARLLALLLVLQALTGLSNVVLQWPLVLAVMHNGGAAALAVVLLAFNFRLAGAAALARRGRQPAPALGSSR